MKPTLEDIKGIALRRYKTRYKVQQTCICMVWLVFFFGTLLGGMFSISPLFPIATGEYKIEKPGNLIVLGSGVFLDGVQLETKWEKPSTNVPLGVVLLTLGLISLIVFFTYAYYYDHKETEYMKQFSQKWVETSEIPDMMP